MMRLCLACGSSIIEQRFSEVEDYEYGTYHKVNYARCSTCGLLMQDPIPPLKRIPSFYPSDYRSHLQFKKKDIFYFVKYIQVLFFARQIARLLKQHKNAKVLEIGCGNGSLLLALQDMGIPHLWGTDISAVSEKRFYQKGILFQKANIDVMFPFDERFDMIILNHVFEHLTNPTFVLAQCKIHLKKRGKIVIATPNSDSLDLEIFKKYWDGINAPRHLYVFSVRSMENFKRSMGFTKLRLYPKPDPGMWAISLQNVLQATQLFRTRLKNGLAWYTLALGILSLPLSLLTAFGRRSPNILYVFE